MTTINLADEFKKLNKKFRNFVRKLMNESETFPELLNQADIAGIPNIDNIEQTTSDVWETIYEDYKPLIKRLVENNFSNIVIADIGLIKNINERIEELISTIIMTKKDILNYLSFLENNENDINLSNQGSKKKIRKIKRKKKSKNNKSKNKKLKNKKSKNKKSKNKKSKNKKSKK